MTEAEGLELIYEVSALTHAHLRSKIACGIYYFLVKNILNNCGTLEASLQKGINDAFTYYHEDLETLVQIAFYHRFMQLEEFKKLPADEISSSGYVVDTLEAAIWCLITTDSFQECLLKAVNLGQDTDTVAAIAGGLAGLYYGYPSIPTEWVEKIQRREELEKLCQR